MNAIISPPAIPTQRLLTVADLAQFPTELPTGPVCYELEEGRLVIMPPPGDQHGAIQLKIAGALLVQGEQRGNGKARTEVGIILGRGPDVVRVPDALFVTNARLPLRRSAEGYLETMPELIVEVRSPNDTMAYLERKAGEYLAAGAVVVWLVNPQARQVVELRRDSAPRTFQDHDALTLDDLIPGFRLLVRDALAE